MRVKLWICLALILIVPGLLFTTSCSKKKPMKDAKSQMDEDAARKAAEEAKRKEQQRLEEERIREENERMIEEAKRRFFNDDVYFAYDSSALDTMAQDMLKQKAQWMRDNPEVNVVIEGHCDNRGTNEYNIALGDRRAESAKKFLINIGIKGTRFVTVSFGEEQPVDDRENEEAWAKNRRVHFSLE